MNSDNEDVLFEIKSEDYLPEHVNETDIMSLNGGRKLKKIKSRKNTFSREDRHALAAEVRKQNVVWDLTHPLHSSTDAVSRAWKEISVKMGEPIQECKAAWSSLRESKRYRTKADQPEWEFAEDLDFLPSANGKKSKYKSPKQKPIVSPRNKKFNYSYFECPSISSTSNSQQSNAARIAESIDPFIMQKSIEVLPQPRLVHHSLWSNLDRMLQKLPEDMVEDINFEFTTILYNKIKQHSKNK